MMYEESIYNLIPPEKVAVVKPPRYVSKYPSDAPPSVSTFGPTVGAQMMTTNMGGSYVPYRKAHGHMKLGATMGPHNDHYADPTSYLTKQTKAPLPDRNQYARRGPSQKAGPPSVDSLPTLTRKPAPNFIQKNAVAAITQEVGNRPKERLDWTAKKSYGKVPGYMKKVQGEINAEKEYIAAAMDQDRAMRESMGPQTRMLPEEERLRLLDDLKTKWEAVNGQYQAMTHQTRLDTIGKVRRKEEWEAELASLEKSIEKLSKPYVFVQDY